MKRLLPLLVVLLAAAPCRALDPVALELSGLIDDVAAVLEKQDQTAIRIGKFTGDGDIPTHFGPEIQRLLIAGFAAKKIAVNQDALVEIKGDYAPATEDPAAPTLKQVFIRVTARLVNTKTRLDLAGVSIVSRAVYGNEAVQRAFAPTVALPPAADQDTRNQEIKKAIQKPEAHAAGAVVRSSAASKFGVEILVLDDANAPEPAAGTPATVEQGLPFVAVRKGQSYRVKLHNAADFDVAVKLSVDGLDQYVFADKEFRKDDGTPKFETVIVPRNGTAVVRGWFRNLKSADAFTVDEYAKGAVAELNASQGEVGVIAVQFHAAWDTAEQLQAESGKDGATRRGDPVNVDLKVVKRFVGVCRDQVSVRYLK